MDEFCFKSSCSPQARARDQRCVFVYILTALLTSPSFMACVFLARNSFQKQFLDTLKHPGKELFFLHIGPNSLTFECHFQVTKEYQSNPTSWKILLASHACAYVPTHLSLLAYQHFGQPLQVFGSEPFGEGCEFRSADVILKSGPSTGTWLRGLVTELDEAIPKNLSPKLLVERQRFLFKGFGNRV